MINAKYNWRKAVRKFKVVMYNFGGRILLYSRQTINATCASGLELESFLNICPKINKNLINIKKIKWVKKNGAKRQLHLVCSLKTLAGIEKQWTTTLSCKRGTF